MLVKIGRYPSERTLKKNPEAERKVEVRIDDHDLWSLDHTLALIIHPALIRLKEIKHGSPCVDPEDAPPELTGEPTDYGHSDDKVHERWEWVMDEMIWSFGKIIKDEYTIDDDKAHRDRIKRGLTLFGKYFQGLWD